ncbi:hypothetical protein JCM8097_007127 [Rhodosporidiobolus ruineniae]
MSAESIPRDQVFNTLWTLIHSEPFDEKAFAEHFTKDFSLHLRPESAVKAVPGFPADGKLHSVAAATDWWRKIFAATIKQLKSFDIYRVVEGGDSLVQHFTVHANAADDKEYNHEVFFVLEFETGTSKVKRIVEYLDAVFPQLFPFLAAETLDLAAISKHFTPDFVLEFHPPSAHKCIPDFPSDGCIRGVEASVRWLRHVLAVLNKEPDGLEMHRLIEGSDTISQHFTVHGIAADGGRYDHEMVYFIEFEDGTSRIKRVLEYLDSAYLAEVVKRTGFKYM